MSGQITTRRGSPVQAESRAPEYELVAIAASLGGVAALRSILSALAADFRLPILICQHLRRGRASVLAQVLAGGTPFRVATARDGDHPCAGNVYVAPPDCHLIVRPDGTLAVTAGDRVNFCRPSADVLFRSVADFYGEGAIAVVLTGRGLDGARGVAHVRRQGGFAIAQDRASAEVFDMPLAAADIGQADLVLPLAQIPAALQILADDHSSAGSGRGSSRWRYDGPSRQEGSGFPLAAMERAGSAPPRP